jgi:hypothetical protein
MDFTLAEIAEIARTPKRAVRLWADAGVIKADPATMDAGTGTHRRFPRKELIVACIIAPFAKQRVAIGGLMTISGRARTEIGRESESYFEAAIAGERNFLLVFWSESKTEGDLRIWGTTWGRAVDGNRSVLQALGIRTAVKVDLIWLDEVLRTVPKI